MAKKLAVIFGIIFVIVGILGFIPNPIVGGSAGVLFLTDTIHNIVHLLVGVLLLVAASKGAKASSMALTTFGVVYIILFIDGLIEGEKLLGFVSQNHADTYLHLVLGIVLIAAGYFTKNKEMGMDNSMM